MSFNSGTDTIGLGVFSDPSAPSSTTIPLGGGSSGDGTSLNELGSFFGGLGTLAGSLINATHTPQPVYVPRSTLPYSSATQGILGTSTSSILTLLIFGVLIFFGFRAFKKA